MRSESGAPDQAPPFGDQLAQASRPRDLRFRRAVVPAGHQRRALDVVVEGGRRSNRPSTVLQAGETGRAGRGRSSNGAVGKQRWNPCESTSGASAPRRPTRSRSSLTTLSSLFPFGRRRDGIIPRGGEG